MKVETFNWGLKELDKVLRTSTYLIGPEVSLADVGVWIYLRVCADFQLILADSANIDAFANLRRFYHHMSTLEPCSKLASRIPIGCFKPSMTANQPSTNQSNKKDRGKPKSTTAVTSTCPGAGEAPSFEQGGKFEPLPEAVEGRVVVRFPPEAGGYLHVGHGKAALLNQKYKELYKGKLLLRFDDTNPAKEKLSFEEAIKTDLRRMRIQWDQESRTSDHFDLLLTYCEQLIRNGRAYVDNTDLETMRLERINRQESACRNKPVETNLSLWSEMKAGSTLGQTCCVRAKIDMSSDNGAMRDPAIYRCKSEPHAHTGTKYKVYPTYDFACPVVDSIEGVTHAMRTSEYNDRNDQYAWFCEALGIRLPHVIDYSRVALQHTVLSKRKLAWIVEDAHLVDSWDDPRMPTVSGLLRRGLTPDGLRQFIFAQGSSRNPTQMEWDKLWAFNKKLIDPKAPRFTGLLLSTSASSKDVPHGLVPVEVKGQEKFVEKSVSYHPKNADLGTRSILVGPRILVEQADASQFQPNTNVTFINWGNLKVMRVHRNPQQPDLVDHIEAELNLNDTNYKSTLKVTWLADCPDKMRSIPIASLSYGHLLTKAVIEKEDDFKAFVNHDSKHEHSLIGDAELALLKQGDIIQLQRRGFYICDQPYEAKCKATGHESPLVLIRIPEGSSKPTGGGGDLESTTGEAIKSSSSVKPKANAAAKTSNLTPEEAEKIAERQRKKDEKREVRKAGKAKYKGGQSADATTTDSKVTPVVKVETTRQQPVVNGSSKASDDKSNPTGKDSKPEKVTKATDTKQKSNKPTENKKTETKKRTKLGMEASKESNFADWYAELMTKAELLEYYNISGCYIIRPWAYSIWQTIQRYLDDHFAELGVENAYFPMFVTKSALECEKTHIADFAPEVAWVTRSGSSELAEPIAIRPTSETIIYPIFAKWIQSHRDLPVKVNQWSNVVRWEFSHPQPFLRNREFLWQEGHTAYAEKADADAEVLRILDLYADVYEKLLAIPVVKGMKTDKERFAGADYTTSVEAFISSSGRAVQGATSHHLGQNFSRMFNVMYDHPVTEQPAHVFQNSWGMSIRTLAVLFMVHGDSQGLVLPPYIAPLQIVIVPCGITVKTSEADRDALVQAANQLATRLREANFRVKCDARVNVSPGWKFNHWELKGVPVRLELGPLEMANQSCCIVLRHNGSKVNLQQSELTTRLPALLQTIHTEMFDKAQVDLRSHIQTVTDLTQLCGALETKSLGLAPFCGSIACEESIKKETARRSKEAIVDPSAPSMGAKSLCSPFKDPLADDSGKDCVIESGVKCFNHSCCGQQAVKWTLFGRSY